MKALRSYGGKDLRYEDIPELFPGPRQVKARITLAGICGTDLHEYAAGPNLMDRIRLGISSFLQHFNQCNFRNDNSTTNFDTRYLSSPNCLISGGSTYSQ
jgi:hypothetical protein